MSRSRHVLVSCKVALESPKPDANFRGFGSAPRIKRCAQPSLYQTHGKSLAARIDDLVKASASNNTSATAEHEDKGAPSASSHCRLLVRKVGSKVVSVRGVGGCLWGVMSRLLSCDFITESGIPTTHDKSSRPPLVPLLPRRKLVKTKNCKILQMDNSRCLLMEARGGRFQRSRCMRSTSYRSCSVAFLLFTQEHY